jgi:hypothetical protein
VVGKYTSKFKTKICAHFVRAVCYVFRVCLTKSKCRIPAKNTCLVHSNGTIKSLLLCTKWIFINNVYSFIFKKTAKVYLLWLLNLKFFHGLFQKYKKKRMKNIWHLEIDHRVYVVVFFETLRGTKCIFTLYSIPLLSLLGLRFPPQTH